MFRINSFKFLSNRNKRLLSIHEHDSMTLLKQYGITVPRGSVCFTPSSSKETALKMDCQDYVIKAQVLAGGRGKGYFTSGLKGGVKLCFR
jgi:succinyl-CoA synthetase beta subunit